MAKNITTKGLIIGIVIAVLISVVASILTFNIMQKNISLSPGYFENHANATTFYSDWWLQGMFQSSANAGGIGLKSANGKQFELQTLPSGAFIIYDRIANQYRMTITSDGNVGIGTTNPQAKLDVNGDIKANNIYTKSEINALLVGQNLSSQGKISEEYLMRATYFAEKNPGTISAYNVTEIDYYKDGVWVSIKDEAKVGDVISIGQAEFTITWIDKNDKKVKMTSGYSSGLQQSYVKLTFDKDTDDSFVAFYVN